MKENSILGHSFGTNRGVGAGTAGPAVAGPKFVLKSS